jgi:hypothetical protein
VVEELLYQEVRKLIEHNIRFIEARRTLSNGIHSQESYIELIDGLLCASKDADEKKIQYDKILELFRVLTGVKEILISKRQEEKKNDNDDEKKKVEVKLNITINGKTLCHDRLGEGYTEILILAINFIMYPHAILLVDEAAQHVHPFLQKKFLLYCSECMNSQIFLTTHSFIFIDNYLADTILYITHNDKRSCIQRIDIDDQKYKALFELGTYPSDYLYANVIVWVEGPSDAPLIEHALSVVAQDVKKKIHYITMFYGGRLRKHYSIDDNSDKLINVLNVGRRVIMICDRDGEDETDPLDKEKVRLNFECLQKDCFPWTTEGREIENYLSNEVISNAFKELLKIPNLELQLDRNQKLSDLLQSKKHLVNRGNRRWLNYNAHKAEIMKLITNHIKTKKHLDRGDFLEKINEVANIIRRCNGIPEKKYKMKKVNQVLKEK